MSNERVLPGLGGSFKGFGDKFSDNWHLWADLNWLQIAVMMNSSVLSQVTSLPGSPSDGEIYIVKVGDANEKKIAVYTRIDYGLSGSAAWIYYVPIEGWSFYVLDEDKNYQYNGTSWVEFAGAGGGGGPVNINTQINDYTLALTDAEGIVEMNKVTANVLLIPTNTAVAFPIGTIISVTMLGVGITSITADATVTLNGVSVGSGALAARFSGVSIYKRGTNEWVVQGDIGTIS